jgi:hypothetical protein
MGVGLLARFSLKPEDSGNIFNFLELPAICWDRQSRGRYPTRSAMPRSYEIAYDPPVIPEQAGFQGMLGPGFLGPRPHPGIARNEKALKPLKTNNAAK